MSKWTTRTKLINQLINRDDDAWFVLACHKYKTDYERIFCEDDCAECTQKWLDEEEEYTPKEE